MRKLVVQLATAITLLGFANYSYAGSYESCEPVCDSAAECNRWGFQIDAGVYPTLWGHRGNVLLDSCDCVAGTTSTTSVNLGELRKFNKEFKLPFIVGAQLSYMLFKSMSLYGELNYIQAGGKNNAFTSAVNSAVDVKLGHYREFSGYFGARYYTPRFFCCTTSFFIGGKLGFILRGAVSAHQITTPTTTTCVCSSPFRREFFKDGIKFSGGGNAGFDIKVNDCWSIVITGEVVASQGPRGSKCVQLTETEITQLAGGSILNVGNVKTELSFPVTFGLKYNF